MTNDCHTTELAELVDIATVTAICGDISAQHWRRMVDAGRAPQPVRLGRALRWRRAELMQWIQDGCPDLRRSEVRND